MEVEMRIAQYQIDLEHCKIEINRFKHEAQKWQQEAERASAESSEIISYSRQVEMELDKQLIAKENTINKLNKEVAKLTQERDKYQSEVVRMREELCSLDKRTTDELGRLRNDNERLSNEVRHLEQVNDDHERSLRITTESLRSAEERLNNELERFALLSTELDVKDELKEHCQRLEDELRDLKHDCGLKDAKLRSIRPSEIRTAASFYRENSLDHRKGFIKKSVDSPLNSIKRSEDPDVSDFRCRVNGASPLARNVSPLISNLLNVLQALESKLLLMHPEKAKDFEVKL